MVDTTIDGFTRRSFIKGAAALTATGALVGCSPQAKNLEEAKLTQEAPETQIFSGACRSNCFGGCALNVHVRDGQVVRTTAREFPESEYTRICSKGATHVGRIYSSKRIQYPMRRVGERGSGEFERLSWDEAIGEICTKWKAITDEFGSTAMAVHYGSGNYGLLGGTGGNGWLTGRFLNVTGSSIIGMDLDYSARPSMHVAPGLTTGTGDTAGFYKAKTFICWGANPAISQPHNMHFIMEAKEQGTRYIVIDPAFNANAAKADWYIPINATTDGALAFGIISEFMAHDWIDMSIVRDHTNAAFLIKEDGLFLHMSDLGVEPTEGKPDPKTGKKTTVDPYAVWDEATTSAVAYADAVKPAIEGITEVNGIAVHTAYDNLKTIVSEYTLENTSEITGVSSTDIAELARVIAEDGPAMIYRMFGYDHYLNAHYNHWPQKLVAILSGNCGSASSGIGQPAFGFMGLNAPANMPTNAADEPCQGVGPQLLYKEVGNIIETGMMGNTPAVLKGVYITALNLLATQSGFDYATQQYLSKLDLVVYSDMMMTETASWADYVLPVCHWFETEEVYLPVGSAPYIVWQDKAIEPMYESRPDFNILKAIGDGLGYSEYFNLSQDEYLAELLDTDIARGLGVTPEALKEKKIVRCVAPFEDLVKATDQAGPVFGTSTGRAELYADIITKVYDIGQEYPMEKEQQPYWEPSPEIGIDCEQRRKFPFHLFSEHLRTHTHSQWWENGYVQEFESEPVLKISPIDAAERSIVTGDNVKVYNDRGYVVMKAVVNPGLPQGMLATPRAWDGSQYIDGRLNSLLRVEYSYAIYNQPFNDVAVDIEKQ